MGSHLNGPIARVLIGLMCAALCGAAGAKTLQDCDGVMRKLDSAAAIQCLQPLAQAGDPQAEWLLGEQYGIVNASTHDADKSAFWLKKAAEHGEIDAQVALAYLYRQGDGVPKDLAEAMKWFRAAADRGDPNAQVNVGLMYFKGWGTPKDVGQAIIWERKAADRGGQPFAMEAELSIAETYLKGDGVPRDYPEAARWFRRAAEHGDPSAYLTLAQMDEKGLGGPPDLLEAYVGYVIALAWLRDQHSPDQVTGLVARHRDDVAAKLTDAQKTKADRLVREYKVGVH
jgi:hypothetical protein